MFQMVECRNIHTSLYRNIAGAKFSDVMERQRIDMGSHQIGMQISTLSTEMSTLTHANAMIKTDLFLLLVTNILPCCVL